MKNVFLHPSVLKEREDSLVIKENRLKVETYYLNIREDILRRREKEANIRSKLLGMLCITLFSAGFVLGVYFPS